MNLSVWKWSDVRQVVVGLVMLLFVLNHRVAGALHITVDNLQLCPMQAIMALGIKLSSVSTLFWLTDASLVFPGQERDFRMPNVLVSMELRHGVYAF